jgi:hypothetical protein
MRQIWLKISFHPTFAAIDQNPEKRFKGGGFMCDGRAAAAGTVHA